MKKKKAETTFQAEVERLEDTVCALEAEDLDLDKALELFEQGVSSLKNARRLLDDAELTVKRVLEDADGTLSDEDVDL